MLDRLESRRLLAAAVAKHVLRIGGTDGNDAVSVTQFHGTLTVVLNGQTSTFDAVGVRRIAVDVGSGDDVVRLQASGGKRRVLIPARLTGGDGNDLLVGGSGADSIEGDAGLDSLNGGLGDDLLSGDYLALPGETAPTAAFGSDGQDVIVGGGGTDTVDYELRHKGVAAQPADGVFDQNVQSEDQLTTIEIIQGGRGDDSLASALAGTALYGNKGNDNLSAPGELDVSLIGGLGDDTTSGGNYVRDLFGNNTVFNPPPDSQLGPGNDMVVATDDATTLNGGGGNDTLIGGPADDTVVLNPGTVASGGDGNDIFLDEGAAKSVSGGAGFDVIEDANGYDTSSSSNTFNGIEFSLEPVRTNAAQSTQRLGRFSGHVLAAQKGAPTATVNDGVLDVTGTAGDDTITLARTNDNITITVNGTVLDTVSAPGLSNVNVDAGDGNDTVDASALAGPDDNLGARLKGGPGNDVLLGSAAGDVIEGDLGNDTVTGGAGNDILSGDYVVLIGETAPRRVNLVDGNDLIRGGDGTDIVDYANRTQPVSIDLSSTTALDGGPRERDRMSGVEIVTGGQADDVLVGSRGNDVLYGSAGNDTITGGRGSDQMLAGAGSDYLIPDRGNDYVDTGNDSARDNVRAVLGGEPTNSAGDLLLGPFNRRDYFTLSHAYFGR